MARRLAPPLLWLIALMSLWMLYVVSSAPPEIALGAASAVFAAGFAVFLRHEEGAHAPPKLRWLARTAVLVPRLFTDTAVVFGVLFRHLAGRDPAVGAFRAVPYEGVFPDELTAAAGDAFTITANSITPNTIVIDVDRVEGLVLLHQLAPESPEQTNRQLVRPA